MIYKICSLLIMAIFYSFYIGKIIIQKRQSIKTNQMGKGSKAKKVLIIEKIMSVATVLTIIIEVISILLIRTHNITWLKIIGLIIGMISCIFFSSAIICMKTSWRVGIPEEKTNIITSGIYKISRNPAFVGFDLLYISILLIFFNIPLLIVSIWAFVMLHLQILQEEKWLKETFKEEYITYSNKVRRYFGRKI